MSLDDVMKLEQYTPKEIGFRVDYDRWHNRDDTSQWFIHWPGSNIREAAQGGNVSSEKASLRDIEDYSLDRDDIDFAGIPYDWSVGNSGSLYRLRGRGRSAATSGDVDHDGRSNSEEGEALMFLVDKDGKVTDEAFSTASKVIKASGYSEVYAHSAAKGIVTDCPGDQVREWIAAGCPDPLADDDEQPDEKPEPTKPKKKTSSKTNWTEKIVADLGYQKRGARGPRVKRVQALLNITGLSSLRVDGIFGPQTERAVEEYQTHFGLGTDGIVGPITWKHLLLSKH